MGDQGDPGEDGSSCSAFDNGNGTYTVSCEDGTSFTVSDGQDVTRSNTTVLTRIDDPADSLNCEAGGRVISHGLDNGDGNGIEANGLLEEGEIDSSTTLCTTLSIGMLLDINLGADSSTPVDFTALNDDQIIFAANDGSKGAELWMVTISSGTVVLVKDIDTRTSSGSGYGSNPSEFILFKDELYFRATDADHGTELWKTDGTRDGTILVKDIRSGTSSSSPTEFTLCNGELYFRAYHPDYGTELWKTNGTGNGTVLVKDIDPRGSSSGSKYSGSPHELTVMGDSLYFAAYDSSGTELWKSDGTRIGTTRIADINEGESGSNPYGFTVLGDYLYFSANDGESGTELWRTSGTGASLVKDIFPGESNGYPNQGYPSYFYVFNNRECLVKSISKENNLDTNIFDFSLG